jgi:uncharacterized protein (TIGR03067 family)
MASLAGLFLAAPSRPGEQATREDRERLQGTWALVTMVVDGRELGDGEGKETYQLTFEEDRYAISTGGRTRTRGAYRLDAARSPKALDTIPSEGEEAGRTRLGIYKLEGDTLTVCAHDPARHHPGQHRPGLDGRAGPRRPAGAAVPLAPVHTFHVNYSGQLNGRLAIHTTGGPKFSWIESDINIAYGSTGALDARLLGGLGDDLLILRVNDYSHHLRSLSAVMDGRGGHYLGIATPNVRVYRSVCPVSTSASTPPMNAVGRALRICKTIRHDG